MMSPILSSLSALLLTLLLSGQLLALPESVPFQTSTLDADRQTVRLGKNMNYLEDAEQRLSLEDILHGDSLDWQQPSDSHVTIGNVDSHYWLATDLKSRVRGDWLISIGHAGINLIEYWWLRDGEVISRGRVGADLPFDQRPFAAPNFELPLQSEAGAHYRLVFRVTMNGFLDFPVTAHSAIGKAESYRRSQLNLGMYYGIAIVMVLYNFMIFIFSREIPYLLYVIFVSCMATFLAVIEGSGFQYLWPQWPVFNHYALALLAGLTLLSATAFTATFLNVFQRPGHLRPLLTIVAALNAITVICSLLLSTSNAFTVIAVSAIITFPTLLYAGCFMWFQGQIYARYFTLSWALLCFFSAWVALAALGVFGWTMTNVWNNFRMASIVEMVLLALALAVRIDFLTRREESSRAESEAKSQFIAQVSHELRTPMNGILGMSSLLREHLPSKQAQHYNDIIYQSGLALLSTINDVLDAAKIEADKLEIERLPFDLRELCQQAVYVIEPQATNKKLQLALHYDSALPAIVEGDPNRIRQILLNFLSNAAKFTEQGEVSVTVAPTDNERVKITVCDSGAGISQADQQQLFSAYAQLDDNPIKSSGTGLGLYICSKLAIAMAGDIGVDSEIGSGSRFWITLPLAASEKTAITLSEQLGRGQFTEAAGKSLDILVAEDNLANQLVIKTLLEKMGHGVTLVDDGAAAVTAFKSKRFDLVLMDYEMPILNGYEACEQIRHFEHEQNKTATPILALTAHALPEYRNRCLQAGMNEVITKPVQTLSLQQALSKYS